ncbi:GNAT family N-acetyltransferase [Isoptericola sp. 4D.3]|uniref:GNAT family N-acetyltransferase n=1 Tax=Isoptericola peretonis TaxID=2918523 RepID=A0ABT0J1G1_9MICO|nr:GNAT family N-acetyltransferase [Isoptericola sp. 4D.3]
MTTPQEPTAPALQDLCVRRASGADRDVLERLWLLFRHDMSTVSGELPRADGRFRDDRLLAALDDLRGDGAPARWRAHLATTGSADGQGGSPVAFALVRGLDAPVRVLSAFFVVRAARRGGVGRDVAAAVLGEVPGAWEIAYQDANAAAAAFWPRVATDVAGDAWAVDHRPVPGRPDLPPDAWLSLTVA